MIEHFSNWLVSLLDHNNEGVLHMHFYKVFNRFGVLAKVRTNQGMEFYGDFQKSCEKALINH
jgi:hypothetical protein